MLQAEPSQLRFLAHQFTSAADEIRRKSTQIESLASHTTSSAGGWKGQGAAAFAVHADFLAGEVRDSVRDFHTVANTLQSLAAKVEDIQHKKQELHRLRDQRSHLHVGLNPMHDAEIVYLDGRIALLEGEITAESYYADLTAAGAFEIVRVRESFHDMWEKIQIIAHAATVKIEHDVIPVLKATWKDIEENPAKYLKKAGELLLDGVEEFLSIPELIDAWHKLTDSNSSWKDRLLGAGELVLYGALDISMFFGVGEEIKAGELAVKGGIKLTEKAGELAAEQGLKAKAVQFFARLGETFGPDLRVMQKVREYKTALAESASRFTFEVKEGARKFSRVLRGLPGDFAYAGVRTEESAKAAFSYFDKAKDTIVNFAKGFKGSASKVADVVAEVSSTASKELKLPADTVGKFTKEAFAGRSFNDKLGAVLEKYNISLERFQELRMKPLQGKEHVPYTKEEAELIEAIRKEVPAPTNKTIMQKIISKDAMEQYLTNTHPYKSVGGFVAKYEDVACLKNAEEVMKELRLDYVAKNNPYWSAAEKRFAKDSVGAIRFPAKQADELKIPFRLNEYDIEKRPLTGNGFTGSESGKVIPEYDFENFYLNLQNGTELYEITQDGNEFLRAIFSAKENRFIPLER